MTSIDSGPVVSSQLRPILDYFGKCPACGYPAEAALLTTGFIDGTITRRVVATCGLPCGWSDHVAPAPMTDAFRR
ncbi:hypothetical protein AB0L57_03600 [Nocardia sp. NPDC052254]|uniref:hypothetical protein n=1 Tax=Nocardia sp. NPDC052254 TaxID=3155681 RepID=UPI00341BD8E9